MPPPPPLSVFCFVLFFLEGVNKVLPLYSFSFFPLCTTLCLTPPHPPVAGFEYRWAERIRSIELKLLPYFELESLLSQSGHGEGVWKAHGPLASSLWACPFFRLLADGLLHKLESPVDSPTENPEAELTLRQHSSLAFQLKSLSVFPQTPVLGGKPAQQLGNKLTEDLRVVSWMQIF